MGILDADITNAFCGAADFIRRQLRCGELTVYAYAIDGLIAAGSASDYILKPISQDLHAKTMEQLYQKAVDGRIYNAVAVTAR